MQWFGQFWNPQSNHLVLGLRLDHNEFTGWESQPINLQSAKRANLRLDVQLLKLARSVK